MPGDRRTHLHPRDIAVAPGMYDLIDLPTTPPSAHGTRLPDASPPAGLGPGHHTASPEHELSTIRVGELWRLRL